MVAKAENYQRFQSFSKTRGGAKTASKKRQEVAHSKDHYVKKKLSF